MVRGIAATAGKGQDAVPGYFLEDAPVPDDAFKLRLTPAVPEKFLKHQDYLSKGLVPASEPFVIAVNGGAVPYVYQEVGFLPEYRAPFPFGPEAIRFDLRTNTFGDSYFTYQAAVKKKSGAVRSRPPFLSRKNPVASTVLYSTAEAFNCGGVLGSELMLVHNPLATSPLPRGYLRIGRECWREATSSSFTTTAPPSMPRSHKAPEEERMEKKGHERICVERFLKAIGRIPTLIEESEAPDFRVNFALRRSVSRLPKRRVSGSGARILRRRRQISRRR